jgi:hypothetical protein
MSKRIIETVRVTAPIRAGKMVSSGARSHPT